MSTIEEAVILTLVSLNLLNNSTVISEIIFSNFHDYLLSVKTGLSLAIKPVGGWYI